jgi:23S rRNA m2A2503 methyltransferase
MPDTKINLFDLPYPSLEEELRKIKQPPFRAQQISDWFYKKLVFDPALMLNIPKDLKEAIAQKFTMYMPEIDQVAHSQTDNSYKFLLKTNDDKLIEAILMLDDKHSTVCVSSMIGCPLACKFCATGTEIGFVRKLTPAEIVGQVLRILKYAQEHKLTQKITNIVFMGMGEPLLNREAVEKAIYILTHTHNFALSPSKISVSTAGVGPGIAKFVHKTRVQLAVSIHFPTHELRSEYMPINQTFPLVALVAELRKINLKRRNSIFIEYLLLQGINDSLTHAKQLLGLIGNLKVKVNLIPYNPIEKFSAEKSSEETINAFAKFLIEKGVFTTVRRSRGLDIEGGCGQFAAKKEQTK